MQNLCPVRASLLFVTLFTCPSVALALALAHASATPPAANERKYTDILAELNRIEKNHPENAKLFQLGVSDAGETIVGIAVGRGGVPHLLVGTHHGNEYGATELSMAFAASLAASPIPNQTIYIIPVLNIEGYNVKRRWESARGQSFDPNRDYPGPCGGEGPFHLKSTAALANFIQQTRIVASATLHTYYPAVVYPWGFSTHDLMTEYEPSFIHLAELATLESKYQVGNSTQVIYPANGTYEDYAFWKHGIWSLLFEVGYSHSPNSHDLEEMARTNVPGLRRMYENAPTHRAEKHEFTGSCDSRLLILDRHDE